MSHLVLGTAGHIDHGKSALVRVLTGIDPDRLPEEQRRGITIELGFADLDLGDGRTLSFVDVPGHERFVRHMVAGATGIDAVLLVVAADQGIQPQTREHLDICRLLGVPQGLIALTKCDLVDEELAEVVALEIRDWVQGTFLETAPLARVSAQSGLGLEALRAEFTRLFDRVAGRGEEGVARLPVDRCFVLHGFGTVVTGTLVSGALDEGQEVEVLPHRARGRIRGLQVHGHKVSRAPAGRRTAVNVQGLDAAEVPRGSTVTSPGALLTTRRAWAELTLLPAAPDSLRRGGSVRFHQGTCERAARFRVIDVAGPDLLFVELYLGADTVLAPGDRFILRRPSPVDTVGGGRILDASPPSRSAWDRRLATHEGSAESGVTARVQRSGLVGLASAQLARELGWTEERVADTAEGLANRNILIRRSGRWLMRVDWEHVAGQVVDQVGAFHASEPLQNGIEREQLRARCAPQMPQELWRSLLEQLADTGQLRLAGERVALASHEVELGPQDRGLSKTIDAAFREAGLEPPDLKQVVAAPDLPRARKLVDLLLTDGALVRIEGGKLFHASALQRLREQLRDYRRQSPTIDVATFKSLAGITRKNAIPLLEQFDQERVTRRVGNLRQILIGN